MPNGKKPDEDVFKVPAEIEAEEAVLGSLLIDPAAVHDISYFLKTDHFYVVRNQWIYQAILDLAEQNSPVDIVTLTSLLTARDQLEEIGGEVGPRLVLRNRPHISQEDLGTGASFGLMGLGCGA